MTSVDLTVVIVNWSTRDDLEACLASLEAAAEGLAVQTVVVDNASSDGSAALARERFPWTEVIENRRNAGFARANNQAFARARGRHILLLNPDTVVNAGALRGLMDFMDRTPGAGAAGLQLRFPDGRLQNSYDSLPTFGSELLSKHLMRLLFPARYPSKRVVPAGPISVDIVIGACLILRREVVETLRGFDEGYFLFMEEADLCFRIRRAGWEIYHLPHLSIVHNAMSSKSQANVHAAIEYARSSYRFWWRCLGPAKAVPLRLLKTLKVMLVNPALSLTASAFTLGRVPRHLRRLRIRGALWAWHFLGCPSSWGMREVSPLRDYGRERAGGRELILSSGCGPGLRALIVCLDGSGDSRHPVRRIADPDGGGMIRIAVSRPRGLLGRLRALRSVPEGILLLERAEEAKDRGIPALSPLAGGSLRRAGLPWFSFAVWREEAGLLPLTPALPSDPAGRSGRLAVLARFVRRLHDCGIDPGPDAGPAILIPEGSPDSPVLADARRSRMGPPLLRGERIAALEGMARAAPGLAPIDRRRFLSAYWRPAGPSASRRERRPIRVLHLFANYKVTGPAETALDVARAVGALPSVAASFAAGRGPRGEDTLRRLAVEKGVRVTDLGLELRKHFSPPALFGDILRLRRALRADPPDLIHCHSHGDHLLAALAAPPRIPIVRSFYGDAAPEMDWRVRRTLLGRCDRLIAYSRAARDALAEEPFRIHAGRLLILEPPIDTGRFDPARLLPDRRPDFSIPPGTFAAGIAARLQTHRRFEVLFEAIALARREVPDLRFVVIGRGTHAETVAREPVRRLGLEGTVHLAGYLRGDDFVAALKALDAAVFLVPGSDGTCRAVREELAMGLPVIAARRGILPELVRDGETGLIVSDTPEALASALVSLARDPDRRARMSAAARAGAVARFSHEVHSAALASIYRSVLAERPYAHRQPPAAGLRPPAASRQPPAGVMSLFHSIPAGFVLLHDTRGDVWARRELDLQALAAALDRLGPAFEGLRPLKSDVKTSVWAGLALGGRTLCLKVYRSARRGRRAFAAHCALWRLGVPVPEPFFLWERSRAAGSGAAVGMEDLSPRPELDRWLSDRLESSGRAGAAALEPIFRALGAALRDIHERGVYLNDLKTCNIFLDGEDPFRFRFVDLDGARIARTVTLKRRMKSLCQLNRSTPIGAGLRSRRAFWVEYRRGLPRGAARRLLRGALALSVERPVVYVARGGLREEAWPAKAWKWPR